MKAFFTNEIRQGGKIGTKIYRIKIFIVGATITRIKISFLDENKKMITKIRLNQTISLFLIIISPILISDLANRSHRTVKRGISNNLQMMKSFECNLTDLRTLHHNDGRCSMCWRTSGLVR